MHWFTDFWDWIDRRLIIRRFLTIGTFWLTVESFLWAARFAETTTKTGSDVGLIIGAVTAPISGLMGYLFKSYSDGRDNV
jgi:hypothetical protein